MASACVQCKLQLQETASDKRRTRNHNETTDPNDRFNHEAYTINVSDASEASHLIGPS